MAYITQSDIETFTGMGYTDFKVAGATMTALQWAAMITLYIPYIEQIINRYCNVTSFDPTTDIVEYHDGRGANNDEFGNSQVGLVYYGINGTTYLSSDTDFYIQEPLYTMTTVEEDVSPKTSVPSWTTRTVRSALAAGDYEVITKNEVTYVHFFQNIPVAGNNNVRITYKTGYGTTTPQYKEIQLCALRMFSNLLLLKKKIQEVSTIRAQGIRDFSQMFDIANESMILTPNIKEVLDKFKRYNIPGDIFL